MKKQVAAAVSGNHTDAELVRRIQAGDEAAFRDFVERFQSRVYFAAYGILRNRENAEDVSQEVFTKVYFAIRQFRFRGSVFSWVYRIAVNECYALLRKQKVKTVGQSESGGAAALMFAADSTPAIADRVERLDFLNKLLVRLREPERLLLIARSVEGFSIGELAAMTGMSESRLKVTLFRLRKRLAKSARRMRPAPRGFDTLAPLRA